MSSIDATILTRSFPSPPLAARDDALCDVAPPDGCSLSDAVTVRRALLAPPTAPIAQRCGAARR